MSSTATATTTFVPSQSLAQKKVRATSSKAFTEASSNMSSPINPTGRSLRARRCSVGSWGRVFGCSADGMADVRSGPDDGNDRTLESVGGRSIGAGSGMPGAAGAGFGVHTMAARAIGGCRPHSVRWG